MLAVLAQAAGAAPSSAELVVFVVVGAISLGSAVSMVLMRNAVHAALMLVVNLFTIAVFFAVLEAQFLAAVQIIVYAGAIMVLFLFVIMLLGVGREDPARRDRVRGQRSMAVVLGVVLFAALAIGVGGPYLARQAACPSPPPAQGQTSTQLTCAGLAAANEQGNTEGIGALLFTHYVWPFEVASVLLVISAIGAMVLGRRTEDPAELVDQVVSAATAEPSDADDSQPRAVEVPAVGLDNPAPSASATDVAGEES